MTIGRSFWVVLFLLLASLIAANIPSLTDPALYYRLALLWAMLIVGSWLWSILSLHRLTIERQARTIRQQVGQVFEERFELINGSRLPRLWIQVKDETDLPGAASSRVLTWIGGNQSRSYLAYTLLNNRGSFTLGPTDLISGDIFGLFKVQRRVSAHSSLLVVPFMAELASFPAPSGILPGGRALHRKTLEATPYAAGVREYAAGDPLNRIHWPTTARRDRLMVKEFEQDPMAELWIFVDAFKFANVTNPEETPVNRGEALWWLRRKVEFHLPPSTIEYVVGAAASIANYYIRQGREVGLVSAAQLYTALPAERGERQLGKILESLALLQPDGELPMVGLVNVQAPHLPKGSTVVLITASTTSSVLIAANELLLRSMYPVVVLIDSASFGGSESPDELEASLAVQGIITYRIRKDDDLKTILDAGSAAGGGQIPWWKS